PWPSTPELEEKYMDFSTTPGAGVVTGVEFVTTFEAQSQYVIGLKKESAYSVTSLEDPSRVVIDIMNDYRSQTAVPPTWRHCCLVKGEGLSLDWNQGDVAAVLNIRDYSR